MKSLEITEDMTIYNVSSQFEQLSALLEQHEELEIDLSKVHEIDTSGIQLLVHLKNKSRSNNKKLSLKNHSEQVIEVFVMYDISSFFDDPIFISGKKVKT